MTADVMLLDPATSYRTLAAALAGMGWELVREPATPPLVPGEPELGTWRRGTDVLAYTCDPVCWLRMLDVSGVSPADRASLAAALPQLDRSALARLLRAGDVTRVLLGVRAAGILGATEHLAALRTLMHHRDPAVADAATRATRSLTT